MIQKAIYYLDSNIIKKILYFSNYEVQVQGEFVLYQNTLFPSQVFIENITDLLNFLY